MDRRHGFPDGPVCPRGAAEAAGPGCPGLYVHAGSFRGGGRRLGAAGPWAPGVITSINQAYLTFTEPGDKIIIQPPVYDHFRLYIERLGRVAVEGLEKLFDAKTKALVLCNPHNPIGLLWDRETLVKLAEICERHGVIVISDEIHGESASGTASSSSPTRSTATWPSTAALIRPSAA